MTRKEWHRIYGTVARLVKAQSLYLWSYVGSNPTCPTKQTNGAAVWDRRLACTQAGGDRYPIAPPISPNALTKWAYVVILINNGMRTRFCPHCSSERIHRVDEADGSHFHECDDCQEAWEHHDEPRKVPMGLPSWHTQDEDEVVIKSNN